MLKTRERNRRILGHAFITSPDELFFTSTLVDHGPGPGDLEEDRKLIQVSLMNPKAQLCYVTSGRYQNQDAHWSRTGQGRQCFTTVPVPFRQRHFNLQTRRDVPACSCHLIRTSRKTLWLLQCTTSLLGSGSTKGTHGVQCETSEIRGTVSHSSSKTKRSAELGAQRCR